MLFHLFCLIIFCLNLVGLKGDGEPKIPNTVLQGPLTKDFQNWLENNGYEDFDFAGKQLGDSQASYGGRQYSSQEVRNRPVIFIHGNSDGALAVGTEEWSQGWSASIEHLLRNGYTTAELYALSYGDRNLSHSLQRAVECAVVIRVRRFVEAVLDYTEAPRVDIIAHSMGVTFARIVIQGHTFTEVVKNDEELDQNAHGHLGNGHKEDNLAKCHIGQSLRNRVHTLIGIAGANFGMCACANETVARSMSACGKKTGFWASSGCPAFTSPADCPAIGLKAECHSHGLHYSAMLRHLNRRRHHKEAKQIISMWSHNDSVLGPTNLAWGHLTSLIPNSDRTIIYDGLSHYALKWATVEKQLGILQNDEENDEEEEEDEKEAKEETEEKYEG